MLFIIGFGNYDKVFTVQESDLKVLIYLRISGFIWPSKWKSNWIKKMDLSICQFISWD